MIPSTAERVAGKARAFNLESLVLTPTASVAPAWAVIAAVMIALSGSLPVLEIRLASSKLKTW